MSITAWPAFGKPLRFIYLQGYLSCSHYNRAPVKEFLNTAAGHPDAKMYYGCFDGGYEAHPRDVVEHFYLYTMTSDGRWSIATEMPAQTAPLEIALMVRREMRDDASEAPDVMIAGHSHGGWMAIRVASQLSLIEGLKIRELLTIDPVSYTLCASKWFPAYITMKVIGWGGEPADCHRAPRDLEAIEPIVAAKTGHHWTNIYQDTMPFVSSGAIASATRNFEYTSKTVFDAFTAHRAAFLDSTSWSRFYRRLKAVASGQAD